MADSFYTNRSPDALYHGSNNFSTRITAAPTDFGLTAAQASDYAALNDVYAAAFIVANEEATRTKPTIQARNDAAIPLRAKASDLAKVINATSTVTNQQKLDLGLNVRKDPEPVGDPGTPTDFTVGFDGGGGVILKWKCSNPANAVGTIYQVYRRDEPTAEYDYLGGVGEKKFVDTTIPAGATQITYKLQAVRSRAAGLWTTFNVTFGTAPTGTATATITAAPKLAA